MVPCQRATSVRWVITVHLGRGPDTSTRVQLDTSIPKLGWQNPKIAYPAIQVTPIINYC